MFTDTHCHIYQEYYDNIDEIYNNAINNNVNRFIVCGCSKKDNDEVLAIKRNDVYKVIGFHPDQASIYQDSDIEELRQYKNQIIAIGEIGLDYYYGKDDIDKQKELFRKQLKLAEELNLPVVIHSRDAVMDTMNILKEYDVQGVIHSFSGSLEVAKEYIKMGFILGINGVITFKNANIKDIYAKIDLSNIILETDSPYLTPTPYRGEKNDPSHVMDVANFVSELKGVSLEELSKITNDNIKRVFDI
jgi:TatD DNase family protein